MFRYKVFWVIILLSLHAVGMSSSARERSKMQGRQAQNFFPRQDSGNPNFQPSPSDIYFVDSSNQLPDTKPKQQFVPNSKFSPNLQADLYNQQYGGASSIQQQQQQQQQILQQQQLQQQQLQQQQLQQQQLQQQQLQQQQQQFQQQQQSQQQLAQYQNQYSQQGHNQYQSKPFYPTPDGNEISFGENSQQQYSPQSQHYVENNNENNNIIYTDPTQYQSQSADPYGQGFSQVVSGSYLVGERPQGPVVLPQHRPTYSLQSPNPSHQYGGGGSRPIYQSQQNYRPPPNGYGNDNEGGLMQSISNFFNNIGQSASDIFSSRPPVSGYQPPPSVGAVISNRPLNPYNQQQQQQHVGVQNQQQFGGQGNQPFGGPNPINQFSKAIEEITRNDDYQCIPKVICQMVGSQRRQPSILNSPIFTAIISAVPSTSAGLVYGRAALLGLIAGEHNCHTSYPRCPRSEDDLLYYLNNHRGGFFRFFNGGAAFGDEATYQQQQQQQQQQSQYQQNQYQTAASQQYYQQSQNGNHRPGFNQQPAPSSDDSSLQSNLAALQNIAEAINNGGGINLSNLGANANLFSGLAGLLNNGGGGTGGNAGAATGGGGGGGGFDLNTLGNLASLFGGETQAIKPSKAPPNDQGQSLTELVGNLLTGFVGQRFSSRKIKKRSIDSPGHRLDSKAFHSYLEKPAKKLSLFKLKLAASKTKFRFPDEVVVTNEEETSRNNDDIESRILNKKPAIYAENDEPNDKFVFDSQRDGKNTHFTNKINGPTPVPSYPNNAPSAVNFGNVGYNNNDEEFRIASNRRPQFDQYQTNQAQSDNNGLHFNRQPSTKDSLKFENPAAVQSSPTKMIFPDRTGTGNLRFDHDEFNRHENQNQNNNYNRYGKILNYGNGRPQNGNSNQVLFDQNDRYSSSAIAQQDYRPSFGSGSSGSNQQYQRPSQSHTPLYSRFPNLSSSSHRDDSSSQNIYVTNSEGKTVYYINAQGKKVYV